MKTLSFHDFEAGRNKTRPLLKLGVEFSLPPGLHLIAAPNGYGKTSFLQTLAGILPPLTGRIRVDGAEYDPTQQVLYVSEYLTFPKFIYPAEWIEFVSRRSWKGELAQDFLPWIQAFHLEPLMKTYLGRMSQGERRKVTWLGAHASQTPLLLLDEPLDGLDLLGIRTAREMLKEWKTKGRTILLVAHQLGEILDLADEVLLIRDQKFVRWSEWKGQAPAQVSAEALRRLSLEFYRT